MAKLKYDYDLIVIGSGAGGSVAAHMVARAGKRVAIVELEGSLGGESLNWGCIPTKSLLHVASTYDRAMAASDYGIRSGTIGYNYPSIKSWKDSVVRKSGGGSSAKAYHQSDGIDVLTGRAHFLDAHTITLNRRHVSAAHFLIATGSSWKIPAVDGLQDIGYLTARTAVDLIRPPKSVFIIGAGAVGCEFSYLFGVFGAKIYLADVESRILGNEDEEVSQVITASFGGERRGITVLPSTKVLRVIKEGPLKRVVFERGGVEQSVKVEEILVAAGKQPNTDIGLENAGVAYDQKGITVTPQLHSIGQKHIYAAGDVTGGYKFTHTATYESRVAAHNILSRKEKLSVDYSAVPRITFIEPEVASVGLSERDCMRRDLKIQKVVVPINTIARSHTAGVRDGFVKLIADSRGVLLGGTIVAPHAGEMIHELTLAIQYKMPCSAIAGVIHAFPSWSEAIRSAAAKIQTK